MTFDDVELLTDQEIAGIYYDVYNGFWRRYRNDLPDWGSPAWDEVVEQACSLVKRYHSHPLAVHMIHELMDQLEGRSKRRGGKNGKTDSEG